MATWWHNSPGYISIDAQQLLLGVSAASTLIPERLHLSVAVYYDTRYFTGQCANQPERKFPDREKL